jgi:hypothetical protein
LLKAAPKHGMQGLGSFPIFNTLLQGFFTPIVPVKVAKGGTKTWHARFGLLPYLQHLASGLLHTHVRPAANPAQLLLHYGLLQNSSKIILIKLLKTNIF